MHQKDGTDGDDVIPQWCLCKQKGVACFFTIRKRNVLHISWVHVFMFFIKPMFCFFCVFVFEKYYPVVAIDNTWKSTINGVWMETTTTIGGIFHCHIWLAEGISPMSNSFFDGQIPLRNSTPSALGHRFGLAGRGSKPVSLRRVSWAVMAWAHVLQEWPLVPRLTDWMGTNYSWIVFWYGITHY